MYSDTDAWQADSFDFQSRLYDSLICFMSFCTWFTNVLQFVPTDCTHWYLEHIIDNYTVTKNQWTNRCIKKKREKRRENSNDRSKVDRGVGLFSSLKGVKPITQGIRFN